MFTVRYVCVKVTASVHYYTCSVCLVIIENCFVVAASYSFFVGVRGSVTRFFSELGVTLPISRMS